MKEEKIFVLFDPKGKPNFNYTGYYKGILQAKVSKSFGFNWSEIKLHGYKVKSLIIKYEL